MPKIIVVTPAGRRKYLECLKHYILADQGISEWHLWDNCRTDEDRRYIHALAEQHQKIRIYKAEGADGAFEAVSRFYSLLRDRSAFYIKMDDDVVYLPPDFAERMFAKAMAERHYYTWWSPMVVNNAICSWILKYHSEIKITAPLTAQASCNIGWRSPRFAYSLHSAFLDAMKSNRLGCFHVADFQVSLSRFSINCIGFFGEDVATLEEKFCPPEANDEEWISAVLPSMTGKPGRIIGDIVVSHFSFFTQEQKLLQSDLLGRYYEAIKQPVTYDISSPSWTIGKRWVDSAKQVLRRVRPGNYRVVLPGMG